VIQISTIQAEHLEPTATLAAEKKPGTTSGPSLRDLVPKARGGGGIRLEDIMFTIHLISNGLWYCEDLTKKDMDRTIFSTALAKGSRLSIYNPQNDGTYLREDWDGYLLKGLWNYNSASVERDLKAFNQNHQLPSTPKE